MKATIKKLPKIYCTWDGCTLSGTYGVFTEDDEFMGDFCRRHAFAEKRRIEKETKIDCAWYKGCSIAGTTKVFEFDNRTTLGLFCKRHAAAQTKRVEKRKLWVSGQKG